MICYRDMTFCPFWEDCANGDNCARALTPQVESDAIQFGMGVSQFVEPPECFVPIMGAIIPKSGTEE